MTHNTGKGIFTYTNSEGEVKNLEVENMAYEEGSETIKVTYKKPAEVDIKKIVDFLNKIKRLKQQLPEDEWGYEAESFYRVFYHIVVRDIEKL
jgi:hypothetical protein